MKLHIDTDIGGDTDDMCALAMVLNSPGVELVGLTTNCDDRGRRAGYARYALNLAGRSSVSVAAGADVALGCYRVPLTLPDERAYWPEPVAPLPGPLDDALDLLEASIGYGAVIVAIGAYTNLAMLERRRPGILARARLILMGGFLFPLRAGLPGWPSEFDWNMQVDAVSAEFVVAHSQPTFVPIAVTAQTFLRRAHIARLRAGGPLARLCARQAEAFARDEQMDVRYGASCAAVPDDIINFQHDALACAIAMGWREGVVIESFSVQTQVIDGWVKQQIDASGVTCNVVTRIDGERLSEHWLDVVAS